MLNSYPNVSIVFPNFNGGKEPLDCLKSIYHLNYPKGKIAVIVIDNNSTDGSDLVIKKLYPGVKLIKNKQNLGFAKAINQAVKISKGQLILITNDDVVFEKNSLKISAEYLSNHPEAGIVGGKIYYKNRPNKVCSSGFVMNKWTGNVHPAPHPNEKKEPDWVQGCAILISKKTLEEVGGLDPNYFLSFDDYDLCLRVKRLGKKVVYLPNAIIYHGESKTVDRDKPLKYYHWYRSKFRFLIKNMPLINVVSIMSFQILLATPYRALKRDGRLIPFLKGFLWNLQNIAQTLKIRGV